MDYSWVIFAVLSLVFAYRGYKQGVLVALSRMVGLVAGYVMVIFFVPDVADFVSHKFAILGVASYLVAGLALFFGTGLVVSFIFWLLKKFIQKGEKPSTLSSAFGAVTGLGFGVAVGFVAVFMVAYFRDVLATKNDTEIALQKKPSSIETLSRSIAGNVVEVVSNAADMDLTTSKISAAIARDPGKVIAQLQAISKSSEVKTLFQSEANQMVLSRNHPEAIARLPAFKELIENPDMRDLVESTGMIDSDEDYELVMAGQIGTLWNRVQAVQTNPEAQRILQDPEFQLLLQSKNPTTLLSNDKFIALAKIILTAENQQVEMQSVNSIDLDPGNSESLLDRLRNRTKKPEKAPPKVYSWTDAEGNTHYSDKPQDQQKNTIR
ncbi:CvpA family protein [Aurantivibrio infirmus]